jgi:hypothetical protein
MLWKVSHKSNPVFGDFWANIAVGALPLPASPHHRTSSALQSHFRFHKNLTTALITHTPNIVRAATRILQFISSNLNCFYLASTHYKISRSTTSSFYHPFPSIVTYGTSQRSYNTGNICILRRDLLASNTKASVCSQTLSPPK